MTGCVVLCQKNDKDRVRRVVLDLSQSIVPMQYTYLELVVINKQNPPATWSKIAELCVVTAVTYLSQ